MCNVHVHVNQGYMGTTCNHACVYMYVRDLRTSAKVGLSAAKQATKVDRNKHVLTRCTCTSSVWRECDYNLMAEVQTLCVHTCMYIHVCTYMYAEPNIAFGKCTDNVSDHFQRWSDVVRCRIFLGKKKSTAGTRTYYLLYIGR